MQEKLFCQDPHRECPSSVRTMLATAKHARQGSVTAVALRKPRKPVDTTPACYVTPAPLDLGRACLRSLSSLSIARVPTINLVSSHQLVATHEQVIFYFLHLMTVATLVHSATRYSVHAKAPSVHFARFRRVKHLMCPGVHRVPRSLTTLTLCTATLPARSCS